MEVFVAREHTITLTRRPEPTKAGDYVFQRDGVKASIYVNKRIFKRGTAPNTITLSSEEDVFRLPGNLDPDAMAKRIALLQERIARKHKRAENELRQADALNAKAAALQATMPKGSKNTCE